MSRDRDVSALRTRLDRGLEDRYRIQRVAGRGGAAVVFLARDLKHGRRVALKVLRPELAEGIGVQRFLNEIRFEASLEHPGVVPIYDSGEVDGLPYYVMPFFPGESLRERLARGGPLPVEEALAIARDVAGALGAAHARGILHRDVKPGNILLHEGRAVVTDFGVARALSRAGATPLTVTGLSIGTPGYMSPEQASAEPKLDERSDQYSLACVLHEMLTGERVFTGPTSRSIVAKHLSLPPPPVRTLRSSVPESVERALLRALEKNPADRFPGIDAFVRALAGTGNGGKSFPARAVGWIRARPGRVAGAALLLAVGAWAVATLPPNDGPAWTGGPPESVTVLALHSASASPEERTLAVRIADRIARELNGWDPVRAVGRAQLSGILHDMGLEGDGFESADAALRVARAAETRAVVGLSVQIEGDSAIVDGNVYDAAAGRLVDPGLVARGLRDRVDDLVGPIVYGLLGLDGEVAAREGLRPGTADPEALVANARGMEALARARLDDAEARFREAVDRDSAYAMALTHLALTLYWQAADGALGWGEASSEITRWSTRASTLLGDDLTERDRSHARAFYDFQVGDYEAARRLYGTILETDPTDLHAWLMLGEVESADPWLVPDPGGSLRPRGDLALALEAFQETIRLQPDFELGYLRFSEVYHDVEEAIDLRACPTFEILRDELVPPWRTPRMEQGHAFCPVVGDSVAWIPKARFDAIATEELEEGADRLYARSVGLLERWAAFAPSAPRPREALADLIVARRARERVAAPERLGELAEEALEHAAAALALETDTVPEDLVRMANLYLGAGRRGEALETARAALASLRTATGGWAAEPPSALANVFLAVGEIGTTLEVVAEAYRDQRRGIEDPVTGRPLWYEGAEPVLMRVKVLGLAGGGEVPLAEELERLVAPWTTAGFDARQRRLLRNHATLRIATTLALHPDHLARWAGDISVDDPLWRALVTADGDPSGARTHLDEARDAPAPSMTRAEHVFALGVAASRLGEDEDAVRWWARLDSLPHRLDGFDLGWGLESLSHLLRAQALERRGLAAPAGDQARAFMTAWAHPDGLAVSRLDAARDLLHRLETSEAPPGPRTDGVPDHPPS